MIKAVLFDVDGVLFDSFEANWKFFQELMPKAGYSAPTREKYAPLFYSTMLDVIKSLIKPASDAEVQRIFEIGKSQTVSYRSDLITSPEKMAETIIALSQKYKLGVVTSRIKGRLFEYPQLKRIKTCFQTVVYFEDTKNHKPNPEPLLLAAQRLKVKPAKTVYIGDAESDKLAASNAGMHFVFYACYPIKNRPQSNDFAQLPKLISELSSP